MRRESEKLRKLKRRRIGRQQFFTALPRRFCMSARITCLIALLTCGTVPLVAQERADTSLAARLERAERMIQVLQQQMAEQARARVTPREGNKVELSGT